MTDTIDENTQARRSLLAQLFAAQAGRKLDDETASAYLLAVRRMDTPRLARVVEKILGDIEVEASPYRAPSPTRLWEVARELRKLPSPREAAPPLELHGAPEQRIDGWAVNANLLLLAYFDRKRAAGVAARYAPDSPYDEKLRHVVPGPLTKARTAVLVRWKDYWARDMREDRDLYDGKLDGKKAWADCMESAEAELDRLIVSERIAA